MESILIGKIVNAHGIKGEVKVYPYTDDLENLTRLSNIYFDSNLSNGHKLKNCRVQKNMLIMKIDGVDDVGKALKLKDTDIYIEKVDISDLDDTYYVEDLIGMEVIDEDEKVLGIITYVFNTGANDIYEVETSDKKCVYIPAIKSVVKNVDIKNKKMYIHMLKGLI